MNLEDVLYVNMYRVARRYGGPEEGGWWYDEGTPIASRLIFREDGESEDEYHAKAEKVRDETQAKFPATGRCPNGRRSEVTIVVENFFARPYPTEKPTYE